MSERRSEAPPDRTPSPAKRRIRGKTPVSENAESLLTPNDLGPEDDPRVYGHSGTRIHDDRVEINLGDLRVPDDERAHTD